MDKNVCDLALRYANALIEREARETVWLATRRPLARMAFEDAELEAKRMHIRLQAACINAANAV